MRLWVIRVFDPKPPWWRAILLLLLACFILYGFLKYVLRSSHSYSQTSTFVYAVDPSSDHPNIEVEWKVETGREGLSDYVIVHPPTLPAGFASAAFINDPIEFIESDDPRAIDARQFFSKRIQSLPSYLDSGSWQSERWNWHRSILPQMTHDYSGTAAYRIIWWPLVRKWVFAAFFGFLLFYTLGWVIVDSRIRTRIRRSEHELCASCTYALDNLGSRVCPECGLDVIRERKLLEAIKRNGYRGLKSFLQTYPD